jgi:general secretion pathway protein M
MRLLDNLRELWGTLDSRTRLYAGYALIVLLAVAVGWSALTSKVAVLEKKRTAREMILKEILPLKVAYQAARQSSDVLTGRMASLKSDDSPAKIIEEIGIKGKGIKIAPVKGEDRRGVIEDAAEIRIDGITLNEAVNLIYRLEKGGRPVTIKKCNLRTRFDDPSRCDLIMTVALLKPQPEQAR